jgi:hypothetical protein
MSLSQAILRDMPTRREIYDRNRWLRSIGNRMTELDLLGNRDEYGNYDVLPLSRVWDWSSYPYEPPISARDWWFVIEGMRPSYVKDRFLSQLCYGISGHYSLEYVDDVRDSMRHNDLTLTFDISTETFLIL